MQRQLLIVRLIDFFVGLAEMILIFRVVFRLFGANVNASFVNWVYQTSDTLLAPFRGIFPSEVIKPGYVLDISALFAILIYALVGYLLLEFVSLPPSRPLRK